MRYWHSGDDCGIGDVAFSLTAPTRAFVHVPFTVTLVRPYGNGSNADFVGIFDYWKSMLVAVSLLIDDIQSLLFFSANKAYAHLR
jgi:hypothetical protein